MPIATTRGYWRLDGYDMKLVEDDVVTVAAVPVRGSTGLRKTLVKRNLPGGGQSLQIPGKQLPTREFTFHLRRPRNGDYYALLRTLVDRLNDSDVLYLHAPTSDTSRAYLDERLAWIVPEPIDVPEETRGIIPLRFQATILGIPEAYGGTARRPVHGTFEKVAGGYKDDAGVTYPLPYVEIEDQLAGWPLAVRQSDNTLAVPPFVASRIEEQPESDGEGARLWKTYDLTDFIHPAVVSTGDVGVFQLYSNPTQNWFEWGSPGIGGIASLSVASFSVGSA